MTGRGGGGGSRGGGYNNKYSDSYDAMQEDFDNPEVNSYELAHGVRLPYTRKKTNDSSKIRLYIGNIPLDFSERALFSALAEAKQEVFNPQIFKSTDPSRSTTYGFVEVETIEAAQEVMKLSRRSPHFLNISFATAKKNQNGENNPPPSISSPPRSIAGSESGGVVATMNRGRGGHGLMEGRRPGSYRPTGGFQHDEEEETLSYPGAGAGGYMGSSERAVTMGRGGGSAFQQQHHSPAGQTPGQSTLPNPSGSSQAEASDQVDALLSAYIAKQYKYMANNEKPGVVGSVKSSGLNILFNLGGCVCCSRPSLYVCAVCKAWYCGNYCRQVDYTPHQLVCRPRKVVGFSPKGEVLLSDAGTTEPGQPVTPDGGNQEGATVLPHSAAPVGRRPQAERNYDDESNFSRVGQPERRGVEEEGSRNGVHEGHGRRRSSVCGGRPFGGGQESGGYHGGPSRDTPRGGGNRGYGGQDRSEGGRAGYGGGQDRPYGNKGPGGQDKADGQGGYGGAQDRSYGNKGQDRADGQGGYGGAQDRSYGNKGQDRADGQGGYGGAQDRSYGRPKGHRDGSLERKGGSTGGQDRSAGKGGYNGDRAYNGGGNRGQSGGSDSRPSSDGGGGRGGGYGGNSYGMKNGGGGRASFQGAPSRQSTGGGYGADEVPKEALQAPLPPPNVESEVVKRSGLSPHPLETGAGGGGAPRSGGGGKIRHTSAEPPIPANVFTEVTVGALTGGSANKFWGYTSEVLVRQADIMKELTSHSAKTQPITSQISPGLRVCAPFMDDWYRAQVLSCSGSEARVIYIDFGNEESVPIASLRPLPSHLLTLPPLAHLFILAEGENNPTLVEELTVNLKPIELVGDAWLVQAEGASYPPPTGGPALPTSQQETEEEEVEVLGCYESGDEYWVMATADLPLLGEMEESLGKHKDIKVEPTLGENYALQLGKFWYRVKLTEKSPALSVLCIDTGLKVPSVKRAELHPIPFEYSTLPQLGFKIKLTSGTPSSLFNLQVEAKFIIKPISKTAEYTVCEAWPTTPRPNHLQSPTYSSRMIDPCFAPLLTGLLKGRDEYTAAEIRQEKHESEPVTMDGEEEEELVNSLSPDKAYHLTIEKVYNEECLSGYISEAGSQEKATHLRLSALLSAAQLENINQLKLKRGLWLAAEWDGLWHRGFVMSVRAKEPQVALVDRGRVVVPSRLASLPPLRQLAASCPRAAVRLYLTSPLSLTTDLIGSVFNVSIVKTGKAGVVVKVGGLGTGALTGWEPLVEEAGLSSAPLPPGCSVQICSFTSPRELYLQPASAEALLRFSELQQAIASHALQCEPLKRRPIYGELVAARFTDGLYHRAQVLKRVGDKYRVKYVDFGNLESVKVSDMIPLAEPLKLVLCFSVRVGLKGILNLPFNKSSIVLLNKLSAQLVKFKIEYEHLSEATLYFEGGDGDLNSHLKDLMTPSWEKKDFDVIKSEVFRGEDLQYEEWREGSELEVAIALVTDSGEVGALRTDSALLKHIQSVLTPSINAYCESFDSFDAYNPRVHELCLALFEEDGNWYRAECRKQYDHGAFEVYFLDYGNTGTVQPNHLRKMVKDFMSTPVPLKICRIYGTEELAPQVLRKELTDLQTSALVLSDSPRQSLLWLHQLKDIFPHLSLPSTVPSPPLPFPSPPPSH